MGRDELLLAPGNKRYMYLSPTLVKTGLHIRRAGITMTPSANKAKTK